MSEISQFSILKILYETHQQWQDLIEGREDGGKLDISSVTHPFAKENLSIESAEEIVNEAPVASKPVPIDQRGLWVDYIQT